MSLLWPPFGFFLVSLLSPLYTLDMSLDVSRDIYRIRTSYYLLSSPPLGIGALIREFLANEEKTGRELFSANSLPTPYLVFKVLSLPTEALAKGLN